MNLEYNKEELAEIHWNLNKWSWDERAGEKPKDWDSLPDYDLKNSNVKTKYYFTSYIMSAIESKIGKKECSRWHHVNILGKTNKQFETWWMDELRRKKNEKDEPKNKEIFMDILNFIENKDKIKCEEFMMNSLSSIERFKKEISQMYTDDILVLSDSPSEEKTYNYTTVFKVQDRSKLPEAIHNHVYELFGEEYKVTINKFTIPVTLKFTVDGCNKSYTLMNYDDGTIIV